MPRIVVLTSGIEFGDRILLSLALLGVVPDAILIAEFPPEPPRSFREQALDLARSRSPRRAAAALLRRALGVIQPPQARPDPFLRWRGMAREYREVGVFNEERMLSALHELRPDYVVLAGTAIMKPPSLEIPTIGTINAHPGLVPFARGLGVVGRSLERGVPVGLTVFFVNPGIDTGEIIHREMIAVSESDTLRSLERKADEQCARALAGVMASAARGERLPRVRQRGRFPYCKWMTPDERREMDIRLAAGHARELYHTWRAFFGSDAIPAGATSYPATVTIEPLPPRSESSPELREA